MNNEKEYYKNQLIRTLLFAGISGFVFSSIFIGLMSETEQSMLPAILGGIFFAGIPCGWSITKKLFGGWIIIGIGGIIVLFLRVLISVSIGIFALPIQIIRYAVKIRNATDSESSEEPADEDTAQM